MRGWRLSSGAALAGLALAACGSSGPGNGAQNTGSSSGRYPIQTQASFPTSQRLAEHTHLVITVRNAGSKSMPDVAVTILNPAAGTAAQAFGKLLPQSQPGQPILAGRSRPVWIIDTPPGSCGYSCKQGGPGGAVTAYSNTWALGKLKPGASARFDWGLTAVAPGTYAVKYVIAADLNGAKAVPEGGGNAPATGLIRVTISGKARQAYVNNNGKIVYSH